MIRWPKSWMVLVVLVGGTGLATAQSRVAGSSSANSTPGIPEPHVEAPTSPVRVQLDLGIGRPVMSVYIKGKGPYRFILDTGAGGSLIDSTVAAGLDLPVIGVSRVGSPGGSVMTIPRALVPTLQIGGVTISNSPAAITDLRSRVPLRVDGVLTYRVFEGLLATIDYADSTLTLESGALTPSLPGAVAIRATRGPLQVAAKVSGRETFLDLDTGAPTTITLPKFWQDSVTLSTPLEPGATVHTLTGMFETWSARMHGSVTVGAAELVDPDVVFIAGDRGNLGGAFMRNVRLTIDSRHNLVRIVPR